MIDLHLISKIETRWVILRQCPPDRERRLFDQLDNLELRGRGVPHEAPSPIPENAFFKQAVLNQELHQHLLELASLSSQIFDLVRGRLAGGIAGEPPLAGLQELLRPAIVEILVMPSLRQSSAVLSSPR